MKEIKVVLEKTEIEYQQTLLIIALLVLSANQDSNAAKNVECLRFPSK